MRKAIEAIDKKLYINSIGEMTEWKEGYKAALEYCRDLINESIDELIVLVVYIMSLCMRMVKSICHASKK